MSRAHPHCLMLIVTLATAWPSHAAAQAQDGQAKDPKAQAEQAEPEQAEPEQAEPEPAEPEHAKLVTITAEKVVVKAQKAEVQREAKKEESLFTLLVGSSGGKLVGDVDHPRLDIWFGANLGFVDFGLYAETLQVELDGRRNEELLEEWIESEKGRRATGLAIGAQLGMHFWLPAEGDLALRLGMMARAGRAGFEAVSDESQNLSVNGYSGELFGTIGVGNASRKYYAQRWAIFLLGGYSGIGVNSIATPAGVYTVRSTTQAAIIGLGFELGYNVPIPL